MSRSLSKWLPLFAVVLGCAASRPVEAFPTSWSRSPYEVQVVVNGMPVREYTHDGRYYVEGSQGDRYALRVRNNTGRRVEVVATVDGLDVVDGKTGDLSKRGYVIGPWQTYDIEGFRLDMGRVAAFRFSSVADSYAAKTGDARNVGVIGVAFFAERFVPRPPPHPPLDYNWYGARDGDMKRAEKSQAYDDFGSAGPGAGKGGAGVTRSSGEAYQMPAASAPPADAAGYGRVQTEESAHYRRGLGTEFGESRDSRVHDTTYQRASSTNPTEVVSVLYNDRQGLLAMGVPIYPPPPTESWMRKPADPFPASPGHSFAAPPVGWRED